MTHKYDLEFYDVKKVYVTDSKNLFCDEWVDGDDSEWNFYLWFTTSWDHVMNFDPLPIGSCRIDHKVDVRTVSGDFVQSGSETVAWYLDREALPPGQLPTERLVEITCEHDETSRRWNLPETIPPH